MRSGPLHSADLRLLPRSRIRYGSWTHRSHGCLPDAAAPVRALAPPAGLRADRHRPARPAPRTAQPYRHRPAPRRTTPRTAWSAGLPGASVTADFAPAHASSRGRTPGGCPNPTCDPRIFRPILLRAMAVGAATPQPPATCTERTDGHVWVIQRRGRDGMRTSQWRHRMKRFVIECFTPSCHVDLASGVEVVPMTSPDTVDSILAVAAGEACRTERTRRLRGADFR